MPAGVRDKAFAQGDVEAVVVVCVWHGKKPLNVGGNKHTFSRWWCGYNDTGIGSVVEGLSILDPV